MVSLRLILLGCPDSLLPLDSNCKRLGNGTSLRNFLLTFLTGHQYVNSHLNTDLNLLQPFAPFNLRSETSGGTLMIRSYVTNPSCWSKYSITCTLHK